MGSQVLEDEQNYPKRRGESRLSRKEWRAKTPEGLKAKSLLKGQMRLPREAKTLFGERSWAGNWEPKKSFKKVQNMSGFVFLNDGSLSPGGDRMRGEKVSRRKIPRTPPQQTTPTFTHRHLRRQQRTPYFPRLTTVPSLLQPVSNYLQRPYSLQSTLCCGNKKSQMQALHFSFWWLPRHEEPEVEHLWDFKKRSGTREKQQAETSEEV